MKEINVKSDFDLILNLTDCRGAKIGWPDFDWRAKLYTVSPINCVTASCVGGVASGCFNDGGRIHIVCKNHRLAVGELRVEFEAHLSDKIYPEGTRREVTPEPLGVELVRGKGDDPTEIEVEMVVPMAVVTAYQIAVSQGFAGTQEDYYRGLSSLTDIATMVSDVSEGKRRLAAALSKQGVAVGSDASFEQMATAVEELRLAVDGEPGVVGQSWNGLPVADLLNIVRNNQRIDLPYCWIARTSDAEVMLSGAEGYLCSDGFFTTESGVTHRIERENPEGQNWVIYYNSTPRYVVANTLRTVTEVVVLNGYPDYSLICDNSNDKWLCGTIRSYTTDAVPDGMEQNITIRGTYTNGIELRGVRNVSLASTIYTRARLWALSFPDLESLNISLQTGSNSERDDLLGHVCFPKLRSFGGDIMLTNCNSLRSVVLPMLEDVSGKTAWRALTENCINLEEVRLPKLVKADASQYASLIRSVQGECHIYLDSAISLDRGVYYRQGQSDGEVHIHLGGHQDETMNIKGGCDSGASGFVHLHVAKGFRSGGKFLNYDGTTHEELLELLDNLADNSGYDAMTLNLGAKLLSKLSDDEKAMFVAKGYTLT